MKANNRRKVFGDAVDLLMDDIEEKTAAGGLRMLPIKKIRPFHDHPFHLYEGDRLEDMVASVREHGILNPVIVQEIDGGYEMLSGHNRMNAAKLVGLKEIPAIVKTDLSEEEAYVYVIETNLMQRSFSDLLISEKAAVLKARYEKESCQGRRNDIIEEIARMEGKELPATCGHGDQRLNTRDMIGKEYELSGSSVGRLLKLNDLIKPFKGIAYYIFSSDIDSISHYQRRDIDIINKLWEDNLEDPSNVIRQTENIIGSNGDYKFQVYSLPNRPIRLSDRFVNSIDMEQKMDIIAGLCRGIESIHNYDIPLYHRNINPDAFYIFNIRGKYKPLLAKFDCTKDSSDAAFTVFQNVERKVHNQNTNQFFAPEVLKANIGIGVDWEKADIYSLAKTILYILSGSVISDLDCLDEIEGLDDDLKIILMEMLDEKPENRPKLKEVLNSL